MADAFSKGRMAPPTGRRLVGGENRKLTDEEVFRLRGEITNRGGETLAVIAARWQVKLSLVKDLSAGRTYRDSPAGSTTSRMAPRLDRRELSHRDDARALRLYEAQHGRVGASYRGRQPGMHLGAFALLILAVALLAVVVGTW